MERAKERTMRVVFCTWVTLIAAGLAVMIVLPLAGR
jgi:hypothetical protein